MNLGFKRFVSNLKNATLLNFKETKLMVVANYVRNTLKIIRKKDTSRQTKLYEDFR